MPSITTTARNLEPGDRLASVNAHRLEAGVATVELRDWCHLLTDEPSECRHVMVRTDTGLLVELNASAMVQVAR